MVAADVSTFRDYVPAIARTRMLVVGDVMLDRYWFGEVERISPEAPVPVVKVSRMEERPGGAANVARNAAALGAQATLLSVIGDDEAGRTLQRLVGEGNIHASLQRDGGAPTTVKLRVIGRQQQLLRVDFETSPGHEILNAKLAEFERLLPLSDVVIVSDYGKGGLTHITTMIERSRAIKKPVLIDPKGEDYARYRGATLLTPNRAEFRQVAGSWNSEEELTKKAQAMRRDLALEALLITRAEDGMSLYTEAGAVHVAAVTREVFDVSGAGDTVIATLGVLLGAGADLFFSVRLANRAAGVVVGRFGTAVVLPSELD